MTVQSEIARVQEEAARLTALVEIYPDLRKSMNRWSRTFYSSQAVNATATDYEIGYSCGCCSDAAMYVRFYVQTCHGKVFAEPFQKCIGELDGEYYDSPSNDWEECVRAMQVPERLIDRLRTHFAEEEHRKLENQSDD